MAFVATDWSFDRATRNLRYIGDDHNGASPSYARAIEIHRALQDFADDLSSSGDDELDITDPNISARSTDNIIALLGGTNIDDGSAEHIYDGSITQNNGDDIYAGFVNFGNTTNIQIIQNGAVLTDDWWNSNGGLNSTDGISHRFMLKVRSGGVNIDNRRIIGTSRNFGFTYSEFTVNFSTAGNNVLALSELVDLNNQTPIGTIAGYTGITNTNEGYASIDINGNGADEFYYSQWDVNTPVNSINDLYERAKWLTREGSSETLYGLPGEVFRGITHQITIDNPTGTFNDVEPVSWSGGTGQMLAIDSPTAGTTMWIQLLTGTAPSDGDTITGTTSSATADVNVTVTSRTLSYPFIGASTGSAIIGSYGVGVQTDDVTASDTLFDLTNSQIVPPNNVVFSVGGLVAGEDTLQVAPWDGSTLDVNGNPAFDRDQLTLDTTLNSDNITSVVTSSAIPSDTPSSGYIRVVDDNGFARRLSYSSWTGNTFTIDSTDGQEDFAGVNATSGNDIWISYLDLVASNSTESFTVVYNSDRNLVVLVRDGGVSPIKEFISSAVLGSSGGSITAIRTTDA